MPQIWNLSTQTLSILEAYEKQANDSANASGYTEREDQVYWSILGERFSTLRQIHDLAHEK
jgi:hypothetical protein